MHQFLVSGGALPPVDALQIGFQPLVELGQIRVDFLAFRLMPLEEKFRKAIGADWSFKEVDRDQRIIQFKDRSEGEVNSWHWDFGDGNFASGIGTSHTYTSAGTFIAVLTVTDDDGGVGTAGIVEMVRAWNLPSALYGTIERLTETGA